MRNQAMEWYLEAAINYTYDESYEDTPEITWRSKTTTITLNEDGEVDLLQLAEAYDALIEEIVKEGEYLSIADITVVDDGNKASSIEIVLTAGTAQSSAPPPPDPIVGEVNFEDYWVWHGNQYYLETGELLLPYSGSGYCDPPNNQIINNIGSTDLLRSYTKNAYPYHHPKDSYWTNVTSYFIDGSVPEGTPNYIWFGWENEDLLKFYLNDELDFEWLTYHKETTGTTCMSPEELDTFINIRIHILIDRLKPEDYEFANIITSWDALWAEPPAVINVLSHTMRIFYGEPVMHALDDGSNESP